MRIIYFGAEVIAERCLAALLQAGHDVVGVVTLPAAPSSPVQRLLQRLRPSGLEALARRHRLPLVRPAKLRAPDFLEWLERQRPDLLVVSIYDKILPPEVLAMARLGGMNLHPSLLPRWRGPAPVARAILSGESETGFTLHMMDEGVDTGPILSLHRIPLQPEDTLLDVFDRMADAAPAAMLGAIAGLGAGTLHAVKQEGVVTGAPRITFAEGHLDWRAPAEHLLRMIRACHPQPGAFAFAGDTVTAILEADPVPGRPGAVPGQVLEAGPRGVVIQAGDGALRCRKLRQQGQLVPTKDYGRIFKEGEAVPSGDWSQIDLSAGLGIPELAR